MGAIVIGIGLIFLTFGVLGLRPDVMNRWREISIRPVWDSLRRLGLDIERNEAVDKWLTQYFLPAFLMLVGTLLVLSGITLL